MRKVGATVLVLALIESIFLRFWLLFAFIIIFGGLQLYLYKFPNSRLIPFFTYWFGPYPHVGERQSNYLFRLSIFAASMSLVSLGLIFLGPLFSHKFHAPSENHPVSMAVFAFGLPLLAGMGLLGTLFCLIKAMWLKFTGNDPYFVGPHKDS